MRINRMVVNRKYKNIYTLINFIQYNHYLEQPTFFYITRCLLFNLIQLYFLNWWFCFTEEDSMLGQINTLNSGYQGEMDDNP